MDDIEKGLWHEMDEAERAIQSSKFLIDDPELNAYVKKVLCRTVGADKCDAARIYLLRSPQFNAAMAPNGMMLVWSGLLLRVRNEAELAAVLGHEFVHFEQQHSLKSFRDMRAKSDAMAWLGFVPGGMLAQIGLMGSVFRFNRDMEKQADVTALGYLSENGYDPLAASQIWEQLLGEMQAQSRAGQSKGTLEEATDFFSSHPNTKIRMEYLRAAAKRKAPGGDRGVSRYSAAIRLWWPKLIDDQIKLNDFAATEYLLSGMARGNWSADLLYARGELYRARGSAGDLVSAERFYRQSVAIDSGQADSWKGLGLVLLRRQQNAEGRRALRKYLELVPDASDKAIIALMAEGVKN